MHAQVNLVSVSENVFILLMWSRRSPPVSRSMMRYSVCESWKAYDMFTIKSCLSEDNILRSLRTLFADFFVITLILDISFIAYSFSSTVLKIENTFPKPPIPIILIFL